MFEDFYNLSGPPFKLNPDPRFFFGSESHRKAMSYLKYGLHQEEGFIVITGDVGSGKSTVVSQLFAELDSQRIVAAKIVTTQIDASEILRLLCADFGIDPGGTDKASLLHALDRFLVYQHDAGRRVLLVIDEAQNLPRATIEELRMLSNLTHKGKPLFQSFLVGQPQFSRTLADPDLEQFRQRVIASYNLEHLASTETRSYIEHRLACVGWRDDPSFTPGAFDLIHAETKGLPRRINLLCNRLLFYGAIENLHRIDETIVREVVADLRDEVVEVAAAGRPAHAGNGAAAGAAAPHANGAAHVDEGEIHALADRLKVVERDLGEHNDALRQVLDLILKHMTVHHSQAEPHA